MHKRSWMSWMSHFVTNEERENKAGNNSFLEMKIKCILRPGLAS
jgi:hypothetical protein